MLPSRRGRPARVPAFLALLLVTATATISVGMRQQVLLSAALGISFALSVLGLVLTITRQVPLIARLKELPPGTGDAELLTLREQTVRNIDVRLYLAVAAFVLPCVAAVFWPLR